MISRRIKDKVCVIHRSRRLRRITQTEALIILDIVRKPNSITVLLYIQNHLVLAGFSANCRPVQKSVIPPLMTSAAEISRQLRDLEGLSEVFRPIASENKN